MRLDRLTTCLFIWLVLSAVASARVVDPNRFSLHDFASEVTYYEPGDDVNTPGSWYNFGFYDKKAAALGTPTRSAKMSTGSMEWVNPLLPAWSRDDVVSVGTTADPCHPAAMVLKFDHRVMHDVRNPYGLDLIVFGNARFYPDIWHGEWMSGDNPTQKVIGNVLYAEPGLVSVAQYANGPWYTYASPVYRRTDSFAPTASRKWNLTASEWGSWLDPTKPLDPNLQASDFYGKTVAQAIDMYDGSAGGAAFDISVFGLAWIQYVRIEQDTDYGFVLEVDAISDVSAPGDMNYDMRVDLRDFAVIAADYKGDIGDISDVCANWLAGSGAGM
jgi:hypothetical protein